MLLRRVLNEPPREPSEARASAGLLSRALQRYQDERSTEALRLQNAARNSMEWFENVRRYIHLPPEQFAYSLLTRSQRVSHENLRLRDRAYLEGVERWFASRESGIGNRESETASSPQRVAPIPDSNSDSPMFTPTRSAASPYPTASSYRRWTSTAPPTACLTIHPSTSAHGPWAEPGSCSPR